jgi:diguanylate cyclase (GGDEF)-like protein
MPRHASQTRWIALRRGVASLAVVALLGVLLRGAALQGTVVASGATVVALGSFGVGSWLHGREHARSWRLSWALLGIALAIATITTVATAQSGSTDSFPVAGDWALAGCAIIAALALGILISTRSRGLAVDVVFEGCIVAISGAAVVSLWAGIRGVSLCDAIGAVLPIATWIVTLWMAFRLLFLTREQITGYRYLAASFLLVASVESALAGGRLAGAPVSRAGTLGLMLCGFSVWGASALHPSMRRTFAPTQPRSSQLSTAQIALCVLGITVSPLALAIGASQVPPNELWGYIVACITAPVLLAWYLVRQVRQRARAEHRAQHDPLTGLPNRTLFHDRVEVAIASTKRSGQNLALMFLDLDRFKAINDSLGHAVGNQLLQAVATRLRDAVRETDTVARMGGDEFTVLLTGVADRSDAETAARKIVAEFARPFVTAGRELHTTTSIGIALYPSDGDDVDTLLKHADAAMYRAKAAGRNAYEFFTADLSVRAQLRLSVEQGLRSTLERRGLELYYQPQVNVQTNQIVGLEALARWPHNGIGLVMPGVFVPVAEETGLIVALGDWAIDEACTDLRTWLDADLEPPPVAVNLSARQLSDERIVEKVARTLERHDIPPHLLTLEITESVFLRDLARATETVKELRELGVSCSIDDFGTGFSGLSYLADMPIDALKIDQSFVSRIDRTQDNEPIIDAIIGLARALRLNVVAEGVETHNQARFLALHGCVEMQGYLFSRPQPRDDTAQLLRLDHSNALDWLSPERRNITPATSKSNLRVTEASLLLTAICAGAAIEYREAEISRLLQALRPNDKKIPTPSTLRTASLRIAAGSFVGLVPLSTGLAAAHVLPSPAQSFIATALSTTTGVNSTNAAHGTPLPTAASNKSHQLIRATLDSASHITPYVQRPDPTGATTLVDPNVLTDTAVHPADFDALARGRTTGGITATRFGGGTSGGGSIGGGGTSGGGSIGGGGSNSGGHGGGGSNSGGHGGGGSNSGGHGGGTSQGTSSDQGNGHGRGNGGNPGNKRG